MANVIGPIEWQWNQWLASGILAMIASESGEGKSAIALRIAQSFLQGKPWPDGTPFTGEPGKVLWCETEAGHAVNLERALAWDLPLGRIVSPLDDPLHDVMLDNPDHFDALKRAAARDDVRFIVIDSLTGAHNKNERSSDDMFPVVKSLASLAQRISKPILLVHHLRKRSIFDSLDVTLDRVRGSSAIVQATRLVWAISRPDLTDDEEKKLHVIKSNIARFPEALGFRIEKSGITFGDPPARPESQSVLEQAVDFLTDRLSQGRVLSTKLYAEADSIGISESTLRRAKKQLGIKCKKEDGPWYWKLPETET
jgi:putative DNA primase/helicase